MVYQILKGMVAAGAMVLLLQIVSNQIMIPRSQNADLIYSGVINGEMVNFSKKNQGDFNTLQVKKIGGLERNFYDINNDLILDRVEDVSSDGGERIYNLGSLKKIRRFGWENPNEKGDEALQAEFEKYISLIRDSSSIN